MVQRVHDAVMHDGLQLCQVHHHSGLAVDRPTNRHLHRVVVAVAINVVALAKHFAVFFVRQVNATKWKVKLEVFGDF